MVLRIALVASVVALLLSMAYAATAMTALCEVMAMMAGGVCIAW